MEWQGKIPVTEDNVTLVALLDLDSVGGVTEKVGGGPWSSHSRRDFGRGGNLARRMSRYQPARTSGATALT